LLYSEVAATYEAMEATTKRLELTQLLADLIVKTPNELVDKVIYLTQGKIHPDFMGIEIGLADRSVMRAIAFTSGHSLKEIEKKYYHFGDIGSVAEDLLQNKGQITLFSEQLTIERVHDVLDRIAKASGLGSLGLRLRLLNRLLADASPKEAKYILRTATGKLRLGIADYTVLDALALAFTNDKGNRPKIERAYNLSGDLGLVANNLALNGLKKIEKFHIKLGHPIRPMLAERLDSGKAILEKMGGTAALEYKLDGERVQISCDSHKFWIFSRRLENITSQYPDLVELSKSNLKGKEYVVEGEVVAIDINTGAYLPFQELMHRRRKHGVEKAVNDYPVSINFFDILFLNGKDLTGLPYQKRRNILVDIVKDDARVNIVPSKVATTVEEIEEFMASAITDGCEGLVVKDQKSVYRAGAREFAWIKLKREYNGEITDSLDLIVVGAFHGRGRRKGKYGAFLLASYDPVNNDFRTVCKVGTGFSDENLIKFFNILIPIKIPNKPNNVVSKIDADVWFNPQVVIEVMGSEITLSSVHTVAMDTVRKGNGLALRFPKFMGRIRSDKGVSDSTSNTELLKMYKRQKKLISKHSDNTH
jgi:DNA ligase-1